MGRWLGLIEIHMAQGEVPAQSVSPSVLLQLCYKWHGSVKEGTSSS